MLNGPQVSWAQFRPFFLRSLNHVAKMTLARLEVFDSIAHGRTQVHLISTPFPSSANHWINPGSGEG